MNKNEKVQFIKANHPDLYAKLEKQVEAVLGDALDVSREDKEEYNKLLLEYCKDYCNNLYKLLAL